MKTQLFLLYPLPKDDFKRKAFCQRVHLFHQQSLYNIPLLLLGSGCLSMFIYMAGSSVYRLSIWLCAFAVVTTAIFICDRLYRHMGRYKDLRGWIILRGTLGWLAFALYGLSPFLLPNDVDQVFLITLYTILLFIWFMSLFSMNPFPEYYVASTLITLLPLSYQMLQQQQFLNLSLVALLPVAMLVALPKAFLLTRTAVRDISYQLLLQQEVDDHLQAKQQLHTSSLYDRPTGLANKRFFLESSQIIVASNLRMNTRIGLVMIDISNIPQLKLKLNEKHLKKMVQITADRLGSSIRASDIAARVCEYRFAVLVANIESEQQLDILSESFTSKLQVELPIKEQETRLQISIGSAIAPDDGDCIDQLYRSAEQRLTQISKLRKRRNMARDDVSLPDLK